MWLNNGDKEINVNDIYACIDIGINLFANSKSGNKELPSGRIEGTLFLLKDGSLHFSNDEPYWISMQMMAEQ